MMALQSIDKMSGISSTLNQFDVRKTTILNAVRIIKLRRAFPSAYGSSFPSIFSPKTLSNPLYNWHAPLWFLFRCREGFTWSCKAFIGRKLNIFFGGNNWLRLRGALWWHNENLLRNWSQTHFMFCLYFVNKSQKVERKFKSAWHASYFGSFTDKICQMEELNLTSNHLLGIIKQGIISLLQQSKWKCLTASIDVVCITFEQSVIR